MSFLGRTVTITAGGSFQQAIRQLNTILGRNRVRREWNRDKFFTKPSQLRYQLRSRRHRKRFAAMVSLVFLYSPLKCYFIGMNGY